MGLLWDVDGTPVLGVLEQRTVIQQILISSISRIPLHLQDIVCGQLMVLPFLFFRSLLIQIGSIIAGQFERDHAFILLSPFSCSFSSRIILVRNKESMSCSFRSFGL